MNKKYKALITSCWIMLFACWLFTIITSKYISIWCENEKFLELCGFIDRNIYIQLPLRLIMYYFNWLFIIYAVLRKPIKYKLWLWSLIIIIFWVFKTVFIEFPIINYIDFAMVIPLIIAQPKKWYRAIIGIGLFFVFSLFCSIIKMGMYDHNTVSNLPSSITIIYSIDIYIICILYYSYEMKGEIENEQLVSILQIKQKVENIKCNFRNWFSSSNPIYRSIRHWRSIRAKDFYFFYCSTIFFIITYGTILLFAILFERPIEISICVIFFHIFRTFDKKTYHASNDLMCWLVSCISFSVITLLSLPLTQSVLACICMSYILTKVMFLIRDYIDIKTDKKNIENFEQLKRMSIDELLEMFSEYDPCYIKAFYDYIHKDKYTTSDAIAIKHHISRMTLFRTINKIKKQINNL